MPDDPIDILTREIQDAINAVALTHGPLSRIAVIGALEVVKLHQVGLLFDAAGEGDDEDPDTE